jgi:hypothetical protein
VWGVVWKTYRVFSAFAFRCCFAGWSGWLYGGDRTWEVTVKGPNFMSLFVREAILVLSMSFLLVREIGTEVVSVLMECCCWR